MAHGDVVEEAFEGAGEAAAAERAARGLDPAAAAAAMEAARSNPALAAEAAAYFRRQRELADLQIRHFDEERRLASQGAAIKRFGDRLRNGLQLFIILVGTAIALGLAAMAWDATQDHGLVVEAFSVPPDLAQQGRTGQVVAKQVLDRLADMQAQTETWRPAGSYSNNWGEALKVQIPETGVSLGELRQYLHVWLGHQTHITGEIYRTGAAMAVAVRAGDGGAKRFSGPDSDLDGLVQQAADQVYETTQPYRYAMFLRSTNRMAEARAVFVRLTRSPERLERAWAHAGLGVQDNIENDIPGFVREERAALAEIPGFTPALTALQNGLFQLGHDQEAADVTAAYLREAAKGNRFIAAEQFAPVTAEVRIARNGYLGDYAAAIRENLVLARTPDRYQNDAFDGLTFYHALAHDAAGARSAALRLGAKDSNRPTGLALAALESGDPAAAAGFLTEARAIDQAAPGGSENALRFDTPWLALAKGRAGDLAGASALIAATPVDCYLCLRMRGAIAELGGDRAGAERWFAQAVAQAPRLPQAYAERGAARFVHGELAGALDDARRANRLGPHFADPLKLWGDVLARRGDRGAARAKYDEALRYAPCWPQLLKARAAVAGS